MTKTFLFGISNFGHFCLPAGWGICLGFGACRLVLTRMTTAQKDLVSTSGHREDSFG
jgi:hypothetical protein